MYVSCVGYQSIYRLVDEEKSWEIDYTGRPDLIHFTDFFPL